MQSEETRIRNLFVLNQIAQGMKIPEEEINTAIDAIIKTMDKMKWIPVKERLPNDGQRVLLSSRGGVELVTWDDELKELYRDFVKVSTAWMSLPKPYDPGVTEWQQKKHHINHLLKYL